VAEKEPGSTYGNSYYAAGMRHGKCSLDEAGNALSRDPSKNTPCKNLKDAVTGTKEWPATAFFVMIIVLLLAAAAASVGQGSAVVGSCYEPGGHWNEEAGLPPYDSAFCEAARVLGAADPGGGPPTYADVWAEYAGQKARRHLDGWEFYRQYADAGTLEIVAPGSPGDGGRLPPDANVTIRFSHGGPGEGRFDYAFAIDYERASWRVPFIVDGEPAYGAEPSCPLGFYYNADAGACSPFPRCPVGTAPHDGVCFTDWVCREPHGGRYFDGEWWSCPPPETRDSLFLPPPAWDVSGESAAELVTSCSGFDDPHARRGTLPDPGSVFCRMVDGLNITASDAWRITEEIDWEEYARQAAAHLVDEWGFYQQVADKRTLEVGVSVTAGGGPVPEMNATVRLDYPRHYQNYYKDGRFIDEGALEYTLAIGIGAGGPVLPVMIDGRPTEGADLGCPDGYFLQWPGPRCSSYDACDYRSPVVNGMCDMSEYCDFFTEGSWSGCPNSPTDEDARRFAEDVAGPLSAPLALLVAVFSAAGAALLYRRRRIRAGRRAGAPG